MNKHLKYAISFAALLLTASCAFDGKLQRPEDSSDPYEAVNRKIFAFNEGFYENVMFPVARGYRKVTTPFIRERVRNVVSNLQEPATAVNHLLQLEFVDSMQSIGRFALNTTLGLGGMFDVAQGWKLEKNKTTFNETMASWCVAEGPYLVLPFLGASSPRGAVGTAVDAFADPVYWATYNDANIRDKITYPYAALKYTSVAESYEGIYNDLKHNSVDFYSTMRSAYQQNQQKFRCRFAPEPEGESYDFDFGIEDETFDETE